MFAQSTASASATVVRPEFQLIEVTNPAGFESQSGRFISCGTIYGRLYFPHGCQPIGGSFKGTVIFDSRKVASKGWHNRATTNYEIHFICSDASNYAKLAKVCDSSNIAINRVRTTKLLREVVATASNVVSFPKQQPVVSAVVETPVVVAMPDHMVEVPQSARRAFPKVACPWVGVAQSPVTRVTLEVEPKLVLALPPAKESVSNHGKYSFMLKYKPHTLRVRVCKRFGILTTGVSDAHIHEYTINQVVKRNISVQAIKSIFK